VVEAALQARVPCETRCYVDTGPILERDFAARAGIGWIGKNTCVLNQQLGSWLLLGVIVTSLPLSDEAQAPAQPDRCGSCTRCIEACPTDALLRPGADGMRQMDASRCISYLTIEKKGAIAPELRAKMGRQVFGCDICQEVCPWNRRAPLAVPAGVKRREELINPSLAWLGGLDARGFKTLFKGSPVERTRLRRVQRNVAIAMGNSGRAEYRARLEAWAAEGADAVLQEAAQWALEQLGAAAEQQAASIEAAHTEQEEL
jgi:epoxyqueuosine reductase